MHEKGIIKVTIFHREILLIKELPIILTETIKDQTFISDSRMPNIIILLLRIVMEIILIRAITPILIIEMKVI